MLILGLVLFFTILYSIQLYFINRKLKKDIDRVLNGKPTIEVLYKAVEIQVEQIQKLNKQLEYYKSHMPKLGNNFNFESAYPYDKKPETVI